MSYLTIDELRIQVEHMARSNMFDIQRVPSGEYKMSGRNTFILWAGFWECAKLHSVINPDSCALNMNNNLQVKD